MVARTLAHYRVLEKISEGGMGEVYRAHDTKLGRDVAIKVLSPALRQSDESGEFEIYLRRFPGAGDKRQVSTGGGTTPVWSRRGRELFFRNGDQIIAVAVKAEKELVLGRPTVLFERPFTPTLFANFDVTADGQRFVDLDDSVAEPPPTHLVLVRNFDEELKRLVPIEQ